MLAELLTPLRKWFTAAFVNSLSDINQGITQPPNGKPSDNFLWFLSYNTKVLASEVAKRRLAEISAMPIPTEPFSVSLKSKLATQADMESDWCRYWLSQLKLPMQFTRKYWEWGFITQVLFDAGMLASGRTGLGLGCGQEPLPCFFASNGCTITAGDQPPGGATATQWTSGNQYSESLDSLYKPEFMDRDRFAESFTFRYVDMNDMPPDLFGRFDFCWSSCVVEHLGSIDQGLAFLKKSVDLLKPGGVSVHTIEFNYLNSPNTLDNCGSVIFQRHHMEDLSRELSHRDITPAVFDFSIGDMILDRYIDLIPFPFHNIPGVDLAASSFYPAQAPHIKLWLEGIPTTSFGIILKKH